MSPDFKEILKASILDGETQLSEMTEHQFVWATAKGIVLGGIIVSVAVLGLQLLVGMGGPRGF